MSRTPRTSFTARRSVVPMVIAAALAFAVVAGACASSNGATSPNSSIVTTTTEGPHPARVRVVGDGGGSAAASELAAALGTTDLVDHSKAGATLASLLDLEPETPAADSGRLHDTLVEAESVAPELVVFSIGSEVLDARSPMAICTDSLWSANDTARFDACVEQELDRMHFEQRTMAILLDLLAHTRTTNVVMLHVPATAASTGLPAGQREEVIRLVNARIDRAAALTAEAGQVWADRSLVTDASGAVDAARARGWID